MDSNLKKLVDDLQAWFTPWRSVLVAYSGGVDSSLVMAAAHAAPGTRALACIGVSPSYPRREMREAVALAEALKVPYRLVDTEEHLDQRYTVNDARRCFFCKDELYGRLRTMAADEAWDLIADGTNVTDLGDDRPGMGAAKRHQVRAPLVELGITKTRVRDLARYLGLPVWDKPAMACLSSRVTRGTPITPALLARIEAAEDVLFQAGLRQFRVRHHGEIARIELLVTDMAAAMALRRRLVEGIQAVGYRHVCLDLAGYQGGEEEAFEVEDLVQVTVGGGA